MYSFKNKWVNLKNVLNIRSTCITKILLTHTAWSMLVFLGSLYKNVFWAESDMYKSKDRCFLYKAQCFRVYLTQFTGNPGGKSKWNSTVLLLKHICNPKTIFYIRVNEWLNNLYDSPDNSYLPACAKMLPLERKNSKQFPSKGVFLF